MNKTYRSIRSTCRLIACATLAVTAGLGMRTAFAFMPIGTGASGSSSDLVIGDNAKGDTTPTYFWIVPDKDPGGNAIPSVGTTIVGNYANANEYAGVTLFGDHTYATGNGAVAFGPNASAGTVATAVGNDSMASGKWSLAFGARSYASADASVALGGMSTASGAYSNAVGVYANASGYGSFAGGFASAAGWGGIAIGLGATQTDDNGVALGALASAGGTSSVAIGYGAHTSSADAIALGKNASALGDRSISIGTGSTVTGARSGAIGDPNTVTGSGSYALGNDNNIGADNAFVMGNNVTAPAGLNGVVVLGNGSTVSAATPVPGMTMNGVAYTFAGGSPAAGDVVSVGSAAAPRQIQNVAAGRISADSTDAINGSQLYATNQAVNENTQDIANLNQQIGGNTQAISNLSNRIDGAQRDANAGTASAMALAGLPQSVLPGKGMVALAGSTYSGQSALALGVSKLSDSGRWVFKGGVTSNTRRNVGATVGAGFHW
ncbi:Autotransporter adhesin UpaG [Cupriavidus pinatubonensis]|uniref:Autotransporter adhesin UpaG n=2 Tax=Cupriavidus pinatubonensis TaxID=248026 RepID=A0ABM8XHN0_9BURK|nr:Autotransporter adhesin UpaG [Cupriavidus pinatubonensis]